MPTNNLKKVLDAYQTLNHSELGQALHAVNVLIRSEISYFTELENLSTVLVRTWKSTDQLPDATMHRLESILHDHQEIPS